MLMCFKIEIYASAIVGRLTFMQSTSLGKVCTSDFVGSGKTSGERHFIGVALFIRMSFNFSTPIISTTSTFFLNASIASRLISFSIFAITSPITL